MSKDLSRNHYSKETLSLAERTQELIGNSKTGKALIHITNGSRHPNYLQLDWFSAGVSANINDRISTFGDQNAGLLPRFWSNAVLLGVSSQEIEKLIEDNPGSQEAAAYMSQDVTHVGVIKDDETQILEVLDETTSGVAMRLGKRSLDATVGVWIPAERHFESVQGVEAIEQSIHIDELSSNYPSVQLT